MLFYNICNLSVCFCLPNMCTGITG